MYNKDKVDELCFELNTELKSDYDIDNIRIKLAELLSVVIPFDENIFKNNQYLSLIRKLTKIKELNNELNSLFISIVSDASFIVLPSVFDKVSILFKIS